MTIGPVRTPCDAGVIRGAARASGCAERDKNWVLAATILGSSMAFLDSSVVNVALPVIQSELAITFRSAQWIVNAYMLMLGALLLVGGAAGDRFGRRKVYVCGVALFSLASVICGFAPNAVSLIAARALQGAGGALLVPSSLAIISAAFTEEERGRAIGTWAGASAITAALGPVLGGWLVDTWSWRAIFFVNIPIAAIVLWLTYWRVPESREQPTRPRMRASGVDWRGGLAATVGLGAIAYGLTSASDLGWTHVAVLAALLGGAAILGAFLWIEAHAAAPMMPLGLFASPTFSGANAMTLLLYFALGGAFFFVPFNLIRIQDYSATLAGAAFLPFSLIMGGLSRWSGTLLEKHGKTPLIVGPLIAAAGFALFAAPGIGGSYWATFFPGMVVLGFGMAVSVAPLTTVVMSDAEDRRAGVASGINNATARIAGMLAVALLGAVAVGVFRSTLEDRLSKLPISAEARDAVLAQAPQLAEAAVPPEIRERREVLERTLDEAFVFSFRVITLASSAMALLAAVCAWLTIGPTHRSEAPQLEIQEDRLDSGMRVRR